MSKTLGREQDSFPLLRCGPDYTFMIYYNYRLLHCRWVYSEKYLSIGLIWCNAFCSERKQTQRPNYSMLIVGL